MEQPVFQLDFGVSIPMSDGVALNADIYRPLVPRPQPALLTLTPYTTSYANRSAAAYARAGFAVVVVDVRGRGGSQGVFDLYNDGADGAACVDWIAAQDWCDGQVALFGGSYAGLNQWTIAAQASAALKAMAPLVAPMPGFDADGLNGLFPLYNLRWSSFIRGRGIQQALFQDEAFWRSLFLRHAQSGAGIEALPVLLGGTDAVLSGMIREFDHPDYWAARVPDEQAFANITIPVLTATGTADNAQRGALEYRRRHLAARPDATHFLLLGPWTHGGQRDPERAAGDPATPDSEAVDTFEHDTLVGFYNWALRGEPLPDILRGSARAEAVYIAGSEVWRRLDLTRMRQPTALYLASQGGLRAQPEPADLALEWPQPVHQSAATHPEADPETPDLFALLGGEQAGTDWIYDPAHGAFLTFATEPLTDIAVFIGAPELDCVLSAAATRVDLACFVYERRADGSTLILSSDMRRVVGLNHRPRPVRFETFRFAARKLAAGSRIGVQIRVLDTLCFQRASAPDRDPPLTLRLQLGASHRNALTLPLLPESALTNG